MKYTFSDEEDDEISDAGSVRRSTRSSQVVTPADPNKPTVTASGRRVKSRLGGLYGESLLSGQTTQGTSPGTGDAAPSDASEGPQAANGRATRSGRNSDANGWNKKRDHIAGYNSVDELDDERDASSTGEEWEGGDEDNYADANADEEDAEEDELSDDVSEEELSVPKYSLIVQLRYRKPTNESTDVTALLPPPAPAQPPPPSPQSLEIRAVSAPLIVAPEILSNGHRQDVDMEMGDNTTIKLNEAVPTQHLKTITTEQPTPPDSAAEQPLLQKMSVEQKPHHPDPAELMEDIRPASSILSSDMSIPAGHAA